MFLSGKYMIYDVKVYYFRCLSILLTSAKHIGFESKAYGKRFIPNLGVFYSQRGNFLFPVWELFLY